MQARQIRAARSLLNWSQNELVSKSSLSLTTIRRMEDESIGPQRSSAGNVDTVRRVLEGAGIQFIENGDVSHGSGVTLRDGSHG
ncbi:helix-turn-helix transcriptional regulator [Brucella anthropi]|uniref:helix-turn-helix transcriptional regulator n=1 Tax=Brucella anthropi TaxID=529 RepID=UPI0009BFAB34|nr:helix-turn-helix transcriptional regulator [Brucella anthropi]